MKRTAPEFSGLMISQFIRQRPTFAKLSKDSGLGFSEKKNLHHHLTDNSCYKPQMLPVQKPTFPFVHVAMFHLHVGKTNPWYMAITTLQPFRVCRYQKPTDNISSSSGSIFYFFRKMHGMMSSPPVFWWSSWHPIDTVDGSEIPNNHLGWLKTL